MLQDHDPVHAIYQRDPRGQYEWGKQRYSDGHVSHDLFLLMCDKAQALGLTSDALRLAREGLQIYDSFPLRKLATEVQRTPLEEALYGAVAGLRRRYRKLRDRS